MNIQARFVVSVLIGFAMIGGVFGIIREGFHLIERVLNPSAMPALFPLLIADVVLLLALAIFAMIQFYG